MAGTLPGATKAAPLFITRRQSEAGMFLDLCNRVGLHSLKNLRPIGWSDLAGDERGAPGGGPRAAPETSLGGRGIREQCGSNKGEFHL